MSYAVIVGSNTFIGTSGVLSVEIDGKQKEFLKVREIYKERAEGSYLALDVDIKDADNQREIKLFKSRPVVQDTNTVVKSDKAHLLAIRADGNIIIKVEQLRSDDPSLAGLQRFQEKIIKHPVDAILKITGDFYAGKFHVIATDTTMTIGGITLSGNLFVGTKGMTLSEKGFSM